MNLTCWLIGAAFVLPGCCSESAQLGGRWVYASPGGIGVASTPNQGQPLSATGAANGCVARAELTQHFGRECDSHEAEAKGTTTMTDDPTMGNHPTPGEVIWYCDRYTVVRVVLARCGDSDNFSVSQVAVGIAPR
jgi:hypothetical protein